MNEKFCYDRTLRPHAAIADNCAANVENNKNNSSPGFNFSLTALYSEIEFWSTLYEKNIFLFYEKNIILFSYKYPFQSNDTEMKQSEQ
jgi:hypothetical protein